MEGAYLRLERRSGVSIKFTNQKSLRRGGRRGSDLTSTSLSGLMLLDVAAVVLGLTGLGGVKKQRLLGQQELVQQFAFAG